MSPACWFFTLSSPPGVDMAHVTVGIPRLRELLMTASVKQPIMRLNVKPGLSKHDVYDLSHRLMAVKLEEIISNVRLYFSCAWTIGTLYCRYLNEDVKFSFDWLGVRVTLWRLHCLVFRLLDWSSTTAPTQQDWDPTSSSRSRFGSCGSRSLWNQIPSECCWSAKFLAEGSRLLVVWVFFDGNLSFWIV